MSKPFKAIVENGYQILQTPGGERVNRIIETIICQGIEKEEATCQFTALVNFNDSLIYDTETNELKTGLGEVLNVKILRFAPISNQHPVDAITAKCSVIFPYDTNHQELTTINQQLTTA